MKAVSRMIRIGMITMLITFGGMLFINTNQVGRASNYTCDTEIYVETGADPSNDSSNPHDCSYH